MTEVSGTGVFCQFYEIFKNTFFNRTPLVAASVLRHLGRKSLTKFHGGLFELEILEIFTTAFFVKNNNLNLNFFQMLQIILPKNRKKNLLKKNANHLKLQ